MKETERPEMKSLLNGAYFKTLDITARAGMEMPLHHSTQEAVIVVLKGNAILKMPNKEHSLAEGKTFIIPPMVAHSLKIKTDFHAIAIMENTSAIAFEE